MSSYETTKLTLAKVDKKAEKQSGKGGRLSGKNYWFSSEGYFNPGLYNSTTETWRKLVKDMSKRFSQTNLIDTLNTSDCVNPIIIISKLEMVPVPTSSTRKGPIIKDWQKTTLGNCNSIDYPNDSGIALVTGKVSNIFVIDIDLPKDGESDGLELIRWVHKTTYEQFNIDNTSKNELTKINHHYANTMVQQSGGGGIHLIYQYEPIFDLIKSGTKSLMDKGKLSSIDFKCNGGCINFTPSKHIVTGKRYELLKEFDGQSTTHYPNFMPTYLIHYIINNLQDTGYSFINISKELYGSNINNVWQTPQMKLDEKEKKTNFISSNSGEINDSIEKIVAKLNLNRFSHYDTWIKFIILLSNISKDHGNTKKYLDLCIKTSEAAPGWDDNSLDLIKNTWKVDKKDSTVNIGTLLYWLKEDLDKKSYYEFLNDNGIYKGRRLDYNYEDRENIFDRFDALENGESGYKAKMNTIFDFFRGCIIPITGELSRGLYYMTKDTEQDTEYGVSNEVYKDTRPTNLKSLLDTIPILNGSKNKKCEPIDVTLSYFLKSMDSGNHRFSKVDFYPYSPKTKVNDITTMFKEKRIMNSFRGFVRKYDANYKIDNALLTPAINQINAFCNDNKTLVNYFIKWLAHIVQYPNIRTGIAILIKSEQGAGKSEFFNWIGHMIIGSPYYNSCSEMEQIVGKFNSVIKNKILIALEEVNVYATDSSTLNKLKELITGRTQNIENKGIDVNGGTSNYCNYVLMTNKNSPIRVESSDRRYFCIESRHLYPTGDRRWTEQINYYKNHEAAINFYHYLMSIDVDINDLKNIPETDTKKRLINSSAPLFARYMYDEYSKIMNESPTVLNKKDNELYCTSELLLNSVNTFCVSNGEKQLDSKTMKNQSINIFGVESKSKWIDDNSGEYCTKANGGRQKQTYVYNFELVKKKLESLKFNMNPHIDMDELDDLE